MHPSLAEIYRQKVANLSASLNNDFARPEATDALRSLVSEIRLFPENAADDGHIIEIYGELGAVLGIVDTRNDKPRRVTGGASVSMVAGAGFEPATFRL